MAIDEMTLLAWVEGELAGAALAEAERALDADPALRARAEAMRSDRAALVGLGTADVAAAGVGAASIDDAIHRGAVGLGGASDFSGQDGWLPETKVMPAREPGVLSLAYWRGRLAGTPGWAVRSGVAAMLALGVGVLGWAGYAALSGGGAGASEELAGGPGDAATPTGGPSWEEWLDRRRAQRDTRAPAEATRPTAGDGGRRTWIAVADTTGTGAGGDREVALTTLAERAREGRLSVVVRGVEASAVRAALQSAADGSRMHSGDAGRVRASADDGGAFALDVPLHTRALGVGVRASDAALLAGALSALAVELGVDEDAVCVRVAGASGVEAADGFDAPDDVFWWRQGVGSLGTERGVRLPIEIVPGG